MTRFDQLLDLGLVDAHVARRVGRPGKAYLRDELIEEASRAVMAARPRRG